MSATPTTPVLVQVSIAACKPFPALQSGSKALALTYWQSEDSAALLHGADDLPTLLQHWHANAPVLQELTGDSATASAIAKHGVDVSQLRLHAPAAPRQVFCAIGNFRGQLTEAALDMDDGPDGPNAPTRRANIDAAIAFRLESKLPYVAMKASAAVAGPADVLRVSPDDKTLDWEVEVGVVIGRSAFQVSIEEALNHVAGYCVVNDITIRERIFRQDAKLMGTDWLQCKSQPGWLPVGPALVPAWNINPKNPFHLKLSLNGKVMQDELSTDMLFGVAEQIAYISRHTRLQPGDLVCTGSPKGFGQHYKRYLQPGDVMEAEVEGLGVLRTECGA